MHELSIALSIVDVAAEQADRLGVRVVAVRLRLGPLSGVVREALLGSWELAREGTPALAEAALEIEDVPLVVYCSACAGERRPASMQHLCCPVCGAPTPSIVSGRELEVSALEVVDVSPDAVVESDRAANAPDAPGRGAPEGAEAE